MQRTVTPSGKPYIGSNPIPSTILAIFTNKSQIIHLRATLLSKVVVKCGSQGEFSLLGSTIYLSVQKKNARRHICVNLTKAFTKEEIARWFNGYRQKVESYFLPINTKIKS